MTDTLDESCPCGSGLNYEDCCKKQYDQANRAREKLKQALNDPDKKKELDNILKQIKK